MRKIRLIGRLAAVFTLLLTFSACGPNISYYKKLNEHLLNRNYKAALEIHRQNKKSYSSQNKALYYLDDGLLAHYAGEYEESNKSLLKAEKIMADLYTRSISREAASFLINDNTTAYAGEDFEAALVNLFLALNFAQLGQLDEALVEARKVDSKLNSFNLQYPAGEKNVYKEDGFIRYLMGVLYSADNEINDAFISFRKAEHIYRKDYAPNYGVAPPPMVIEDLLWAAKQMNFNDEYNRYSRSYRNIEQHLKPRAPNDAMVNFIHFNGRGAEKVEKHFFVPMPDGYVVKMAYPEFKKQTYHVTHARVLLTRMENRKNYQIPFQLMENISAIAKKNLKNRIGRITAKAVARVTAKYLLAKEAEKKALKEGDKNLARVIKFGFQTYMIAFENADIRHWRLLPDQIQVGRARLPAGKYEGTIQLLNRNGSPVDSLPMAPFSLTAGETKFMTFRTVK